MPELWAGIDAGKAHHHCVVINAEGKRLLSRRVANDEAELLELIANAISLAESATVTWAVDLNSGGAALLLALLADRGQQLLYIPGRTVFHAAASYRGDGKPTPKTRRSSPTRPGCAATCNHYASVTRSAPIYASSPPGAPM